jgi:hypothetical protein
LWIEVGGEADAFWSQTPFTFTLFVRAKTRALKGVHDGRQWLAWHIGYLGRVTEFPSWEAFTSKRQDQTVVEMEFAGRLLAAGGLGTYEPPPSKGPSE